jgi:hypothetical protein
MKILHVNTYDTGGAAKAAIRLHLGLLEENVNSKMLIKHKSQDIPETYKISITAKKSNILDAVIARLKCFGIN